MTVFDEVHQLTVGSIGGEEISWSTYISQQHDNFESPLANSRL